MVEIFKTNMSSRANAHLAAGSLMLSYPNINISFDLEDSDKVMRIESEEKFNRKEVIKFFDRLGYLIQPLK